MNFKKITQFMATFLAAIAIGGIASATMSTADKLVLRTAIKNNPVADHVSGLLDREENQTSVPAAAQWTISSCGAVANGRNIVLQLKNNTAVGRNGGASNANLSTRAVLFCYLSTDPAGGSAPVAFTTFTTDGTNGFVSPVTAATTLFAISGATGIVGLQETRASCGAVSYYAVCVGPDQYLYVSPVFTN